MSDRIDWKNYDYSEGPPRSSVPKKSSRDLLLVQPSTPTYPVTTTVPNDATPKSTHDLTNYEDELLAKITSQQDCDRKLTYRPSKSATHRGISAASPTYSKPSPVPTWTGNTSLRSSPVITPSSHIAVPQLSAPSSTASHVSPARAETVPTGSRERYTPNNESADFPLDEDPTRADTARVDLVDAKNSTIQTTSSSQRTTSLDTLGKQQQHASLQVPSLEPYQPIRTESFSYTSFGKDKYIEADDAEMTSDLERGDDDFMQKHSEQPQTIIMHGIDHGDNDILKWNQAREEWNLMFQEIQKTYQSGKAHEEQSTSSQHLDQWDENESEYVALCKATFTTASPAPIQSMIVPHPANPRLVGKDNSSIESLSGYSKETLTPENEPSLNNTKALPEIVEPWKIHAKAPITTTLNESFDTQVTSNSPHITKSTQPISYYEPETSSDDEEYDYKMHSYMDPQQYIQKPASSPKLQEKVHSRPKSSSRVGFHSDERNQIHEYIPEEEEPSVVTYENDEEDTYKSEATLSLAEESFAGRSVNSLYSKSNLSEVEDFFSDILLLGSSDYRNPGRRPLKYKSNRRHAVDLMEEHEYEKERDRFQKQAQTMLDDSGEESTTTDGGESMTLTTIDDDTPRRKYNRKQNMDDSTNDDFTFNDFEDDEEGTFLDTVDDETYETEQDDVSTHLERYQKRYSRKQKNENHDDDGPSSLSVLWGFFENSMAVLNEAIDNAMSTSTLSESKVVEVTGMDHEMTREEFLRIAFDSVFRRKSLNARSSQNKYLDESDMEEILTQISLSAARSRHAAKNLIYDETASLDVMKHIKIFSVIIPLPLGLLFEESPHCCWVSRIFDKGNAALFAEKTNNKVLLGDHLVAVNDTTVVNLNVAKVCKVLSVVKDPSCVELTFIRYIGPIRHSCANLEHEGYEVVDPILSGSKEAPKMKQKSVMNRKVSDPNGNKPKGATQLSKKEDSKNKFKLMKMFQRR